jgi:hypothetical protein
MTCDCVSAYQFLRVGCEAIILTQKFFCLEDGHVLQLCFNIPGAKSKLWDSVPHTDHLIF